MMTRADAAAILQIPPTASAEEARRAYQELFTEHQVRLTNAPTPALRNLYQARLREIDEARDAMLAQESADDTDLPLAEPKLPGTSGAGWRSEADSRREPVQPAPPARSGSQAPPPLREAGSPKPQPAPPKTAATTAESAADRKAQPPGSQRDIGLTSGAPKNPKRALIIAAAVVIGLIGYFVYNRGRVKDGEVIPVVNADTANLKFDTLVAGMRAESLRRRIAAGEKFEDIARSESSDPSSGQNGGSLGTVDDKEFVPEFRDAADTLTIGAVSHPVLTGFGYHLIKVSARQGHTVTVRHILIPITHNPEGYNVYLRKQLQENLAIGRIEFARGDYDKVNSALSLAEVFTSKLPAAAATDTVIAPLKVKLDSLRAKLDRACQAENAIAEQRNERLKCTFGLGVQRT